MISRFGLLLRALWHAVILGEAVGFQHILSDRGLHRLQHSSHVPTRSSVTSSNLLNTPTASASIANPWQQSNVKVGTVLNLFRNRKRSDDTAVVAENIKLSPRQLRRLVNHPLHQAGQTLMAASVQSMAMLFYNVWTMEHKEVQSRLLAAGTHLAAASKTWDSDWGTTQECLADAASVFADISDTFGSAQIDDAESLATLFEAVGLELEDMSKIEKRRKTRDNLFAIRDHLGSVADILQENSVCVSDDHDMIASFVGASDCFERLGQRYS